jgi:predicted metal-binding protein
MLTTVIAAIVILGICIFGMCFNIIFRKDGKFPETEISRNEEMRKRGIKCMREQEEEMFRGKGSKNSVSCEGGNGSACSACSFYDGSK